MVTTVNLPERIVKQLDILAAANNRSRSAEVRSILTQHLREETERQVKMFEALALYPPEE